MTAALAEESLAATLANRAMDAAKAEAIDWTPVEECLHALERLNTTGLEADLAVWARHIASPGGGLPLLGAGRRAAPYPALLWNGDRCSRAGMGLAVALTLVALAVGQENEAEATRLVQGVRAGLAIGDSRSWPGGRVAAPTASATTDVIPAAACAAVSAGLGLDDLAKVLDLAGSLMIIKPASPVGSAQMSGQWSGHALAAGWLAVQLHRAGVSGMSGGLGHTIACVEGPRNDNPQRISAPSDAVRDLLRGPPATVSTRRIMETLG